MDKHRNEEAAALMSVQEAFRLGFSNIERIAHDPALKIYLAPIQSSDAYQTQARKLTGLRQQHGDEFALWLPQ